jgi:EAL domain-containing protein (putative c-di-GMP-specific phosphodiesterase class I)
VEALARWMHPELGAIPPDHFVPIAQQAGAGFALDVFMLRLACGEVAGHPSLSVIVNISALHLSDPRLVRTISDILDGAALLPHRLALEITERDALRQPEVAIRALNELKGLGVAIHLDDFGRGHSSLSYLERLPVDVVKLDRDFIPRSGRGEDVLAALVALVAAFGHQLLAEGVETAEDLRKVQATGCHFAQGFFISRPLPADRLPEFLSGRRVV